MKKPTILLITFLTLIFCSNTLMSQSIEEASTNPKEKFHELGINATGFINEFISLNSNDSDIGAYMVTYKYHIGNNALRFGLGGKYSQLDEGVSSSGTRNTFDQVINIRAGYEWNKTITKRWGFYTGVDVLANSSTSKSISDTFEKVELSNSTTSFGGGGILGVQFFINSHISLATEGSFYYQHSIIRDKEIFSNNSEFNKDDKDTNNIATFGLPTALFLIIRF